MRNEKLRNVAIIAHVDQVTTDTQDDRDAEITAML